MSLKLKAAVVGCGIAFVLGGSAFANPKSINWSGYYIGANAGFANGDLRGHYDEGEDDRPRDFRSTGAIFGLQGGYNWQVGRKVYGIELDVTGGDILNRFDVGGAGDPAWATFRTSLLSSARFRSGIAVDNILLFSSIGVGFWPLQIVGYRSDGCAEQLLAQLQCAGAGHRSGRRLALLAAMESAR